EIPFYQENQNGTNPTHSQIAKDHDDNPLHILAAENAKIMIRDLGSLMRRAWQEPEQYTQTLLDRVDIYFTHPWQYDMNNTIEPIQAIYHNSLQWADSHPDKMKQAARYEGSVEHARKELQDIIDKNSAFVEYAIETYKTIME
ncbi:MAG TPA: hypothetical protein ENJ60_13410, partial [Aeromonadales bacterium]|nr:hypothetical protein [Aeromonadales bacterium]